MGFVVLHMEKAHGSDSGTTAHIERSIIPKNADPTRTHLNRRLIEYPDRVKDRSAAIQRRLEEAGLTRKVGSNQVRAIRINVSATHEDMERIQREGRLNEWCADNLRYFADTFGKENIVAAHLHMDEKTPHMHVTLVPIVKGERKRRKREEQAKKRYRKKPADSVRLCADDIMSRLKLKSYQDSYAAAMAKYGLQRGIDGSEARHVSTQQYYRDIKRQTKELKAEVVELQEQKDTAREELTRTKKEIQTERLKGAATTAAANIAESVGSLFGNNKVKTLERENTALHREVADHEETIEALQTRIQTLQADHSRQLLDMQQKHINELAQTETNLKREISRLTVLLNKTLKWFPQIKDMINIERLCLAVGFNKEQTATLLTGRPIEYNGELYSEEHKRKFMAKDVKAKVFSDNGRFILTIDLRPIGEWFKEQFERLRQTIRQPVIPQWKDRGMKL
ncbi:MobV family relaxase [uncultured Muribaculum sp.]|jgi:predicted  nucleic acid-binding Zn-ribbon protein|uniref:MobV family relaxase n=1 Tax=uncultured Muribaculum sp. TaxID=1918613 RepID=UPI0026706BB1|nr:MobV family relaxase [uncultured Muribaculum sp.]